MDKYFIEELNKTIKEYKSWAKLLKADIEKFDDSTAIEEKGELRAVKIAIQDLTKLKNLYSKKRK